MCVCVVFGARFGNVYVCAFIYVVCCIIFLVLSEGLLEILLLCPVSQADLAIL